MRRRSSLAAALYGAVLAVVAVLSGPGRQAMAQSGVQTTPDGKHVLVSKDVGAERWAISLTPADGTVTGNVFAPGGGPPQFVWCQQREPAPDPAGELSFSCFGADACVASPCVASSWRFISDVALPASFFVPGEDRDVGVRHFTFSRPSTTVGAAERLLDTFVWYPSAAGNGSRVFGGLEDAALASGGPFPLLLFSHGSCSIPGAASFLATALAKRGFVVVAPTHPGNSFDEYPSCADGAAVLDAYVNRVGDVTYVLDRMLEISASPGEPLSDAIDPSRIGMSGWSFGGQTTLQMAARDPRVRAALAFAPAGVEFVTADLPSIEVPTMIIGAELDSFAPFAEQSRPAFESLRRPRYLVELLDTGHFAFADICSPGLVPIRDFPDCAPETIDQAAAHELVLRFALPFVALYVEGDASAAAKLTPETAPPGVTYVAEP